MEQDIYELIKSEIRDNVTRARDTLHGVERSNVLKNCAEALGHLNAAEAQARALDRFKALVQQNSVPTQPEVTRPTA